MQYIRVGKDKPQDPREQGVELAGINIPVPATPDFLVKQEVKEEIKQEPDAAPASDAPAPRPRRQRVIGLREDDADGICAVKRSEQ